jgi:catechol 2,3-dioxygenase-like lactoylglutathione lyase family enzyme
VTVAQVLVIGLDPARIQGWDPEPVQAAMARGRARFDEYGIAADWCLVALDEDPEGMIVEALTRGDYACVVIGGGLRKDEPLLELFERTVNLVRRHAPGAAIAFNRSPEDCADAALRWLRLPAAAPADPEPADSPAPRRPAVRQLRLVVEAEDYEAAVAFYRDVLGLPEQAAFSGGGGAEVVIMDAGRATLELANPAQKKMIDEVEVGRQVAPRIRVAFEVDDTRGVTDRLVSAGAEQVAPPTVTPWRSLNSRLEAPAELQITLFQELLSLEERRPLTGFGTDAGRHGDAGDGS